MDIRILIIAAIWARDNKSLGGIPNITFGVLSGKSVIVSVVVIIPRVLQNTTKGPRRT